MFSLLLNQRAFAAAFITPTGKRILVRILEETDTTYKVETERPDGGRMVVTVDKSKVDPFATAPGKGRIVDIKGKVEIKKVGRTHFMPAEKDMSVIPGDEIRTGPKSQAVLTLETTAIQGVGDNSHFALKSLETNPELKKIQVEVGLPKGKLWSEVGRLRTKDSKFEIETPTAVTGVRGTVFRLNVEEETKKTTISVLAGKVAGKTKGVDMPEVILGKKESLVFREGQEPSKLSPSELLLHIKELIVEWVKQSEYFKSVTALAGIGEMEEIVIQPGVPAPQRQLVYDSIQAGWEKASEDFFQIDKALKLFYLDFAHFPTAAEGGLRALVESTGTPQWNGPYTDERFLKDHYGVPYGYALKRDVHNETYVEITTFGYDKERGTSDDRTKKILEEDARRWEDRKSYR